MCLNDFADDGFIFCFRCCFNLLLVYDLCSSLHFLPCNHNTHAARWSLAQRKWDFVWNASYGSGRCLLKLLFYFWFSGSSLFMVFSFRVGASPVFWFCLTWKRGQRKSPLMHSTFLLYGNCFICFFFCISHAYRLIRQMLSVQTSTSLIQRSFMVVNSLTVRHTLVVTWNA